MIIGLIGEAGVGKSTLAKILHTELSKLEGIEANVYSFASALRNEITATLPSLDEKYEAWDRIPDEAKLGIQELKEYPNLIRLKPTTNNVRILLQWWGTAYRRKQDPYYWIKRWGNNLPDIGSVIVDDVRFRNEAEMIKSVGGYLVRLIPENKPPQVTAHVSENIDSWWIPNMGIKHTLKFGDRRVQLANATALLRTFTSIGWS